MFRWRKTFDVTEGKCKRKGEKKGIGKEKFLKIKQELFNKL